MTLWGLLFALVATVLTIRWRRCWQAFWRDARPVTRAPAWWMAWPPGASGFNRAQRVLWLTLPWGWITAVAAVLFPNIPQRSLFARSAPPLDAVAAIGLVFVALWVASTTVIVLVFACGRPRILIPPGLRRPVGTAHRAAPSRARGRGS